jgi:hypothetical protein
MRFVAVKSEESQAAAVVFRTRDLLVRQRTQIINALRGHLAEFGIIVAQGPARVVKLILIVEDPEGLLPEMARPVLGSARLRRWESERCTDCLLSGRVPLYGGRPEREPLQDGGWRVCSNVNHPCWSDLLLLTRWLVSFGHLWPRAEPISLRARQGNLQRSGGCRR